MEGTAMDCDQPVPDSQSVQGATTSMQSLNINSVTPVASVSSVASVASVKKSTKSKREFEEELTKLANGANIKEELEELPDVIDESVFNAVKMINRIRKSSVKKQKTDVEVVDERRIKNEAASTYIDNLIRSINNYTAEQDSRDDIVVKITKPNEADWSTSENMMAAYGRYVEANNMVGVPSLLSSYYIGQVFNSRAKKVIQEDVAKEVNLSVKTVQRYLHFYEMALKYPGLLMSGYTYSNLLDNKKVIEQAFCGGNQQAIDAFSRRLKSTVFAIEIEAPE